MRYLLLFILAYYIYRIIKRFIGDIKIRVADSETVKPGQAESHPRLNVDEADIEDAEFKDLE